MNNSQVFRIDDAIPFDGRKRLLIDTGSSRNLIRVARRDTTVKRKYKEMLAADYVLYFHDKTISRLYQRRYVSELFRRRDLRRHKDVYYTLDRPVGRKVNQHDPRRLLVIFPCMPPAEKYDSHLMPDRMFTKFFDGIERNIVKNVFTMRIMDLNVSHGSHFVQTVNYPTFEEEIQDAIRHVIEEGQFEIDDVVLYGASKGGTGALLHGAALNVKTLAVDPILNIGGENEENDRRMLKGLREEDLVPKINEHLSKSTFAKHVICSDRVPKYYKDSLRLQGNGLRLHNITDDRITAHPEVSRNSVPEQMMLLNLMFMGHWFDTVC